MLFFRNLFLRWSRVQELGLTRNPGHVPKRLPSSSWRGLYVAALFETDKERMAQRIADAERALVVRARELFQASGNHLEEAAAIDDALYALHALEQCTGADARQCAQWRV